jgi:aspartate aminotransferase
MAIQLSNRVNQIKPSPTTAANARANQLKAAGRDIINLTVGEPDFDTPECVKQAAIAAINQNFTKYTAVEGIPALKQAIVNKLKRDNQLNYTCDQIIVSNGVKQSLYNLTQAILNPDDEVIIPAPYWVSYPAMVTLAGGKSVILKTDIAQKLKITPDQLEAAVTDKTRLLIINSPSNPSGVAYTSDELRALADVLVKHPNILIATDDMYEYILWGMDKFVNLLNVAPELTDRTVVMNGMSKCYAMTGWRIGYAAAPVKLVNAMETIQSHSTSNANSIAQKASIAGLEHDKNYYQSMYDAFQHRHQLTYNAMKAIPGVDCIPADGTFYLFPNVSKIITQLGLNSDLELAELLLDKASVAIVPGTAFGSPGYIRISYAIDEQQLKTALERITQVFCDHISLINP